jgi:hypothetical protein
VCVGSRVWFLTINTHFQDLQSRSCTPSQLVASQLLGYCDWPIVGQFISQGKKGREVREIKAALRSVLQLHQRFGEFACGKVDGPLRGRSAHLFCQFSERRERKRLIQSKRRQPIVKVRQGDDWQLRKRSHEAGLVDAGKGAGLLLADAGDAGKKRAQRERGGFSQMGQSSHSHLRHQSLAVLTHPCPS